MHDQFGNPVTCDSEAALAAYDRAVDAHLHAWPGVLEAAQEAIDQSPDFGLVHALRALVLAGRGQSAEARQALEQARNAPDPNSRERSQIELVGAIIEGRSREALGMLMAHARRFPCDALAVSTGLGAYGLIAFSGRADHNAARLEFLEALAAHYPADFAWLLAYRGWARIELDAVQEGMAMAQRAIQLRPANAHNAHMVMHGFHEAGQPREALEFLKEWLPGYPDFALMWGHLQWHAALAQLELGHVDEAVRLLLGAISDHLPLGTPFMGLADMASLLWRLGLGGVTGLPWTVIEQHAQRHYPKGSNVFGELHLAMIAAARADLEALTAAHRRLQAAAEAGHEGAPVAARWVLGLRCLLQGDRDAAKADLEACWEGAPRLGGSNAQRSVIRQTLDALVVPQAGPG